MKETRVKTHSSGLSGVCKGILNDRLGTKDADPLPIGEPEAIGEWGSNPRWHISNCMRAVGDSRSVRVSKESQLIDLEGPLKLAWKSGIPDSRCSSLEPPLDMQVEQ